MGPEGADQLAPLSSAFARVYAMVQPQRLLVLGCTTGNGFEHIEPAVTRRVVGVDLHPGYLEVARTRHGRLGEALELICSPAEQCTFAPHSFDLVHAALFFEWVEPSAMVRAISGWLAPGGLLCAIVQLEAGSQAKVTASNYASVQCLKHVMTLIAPGVMEGLASQNGLDPVRSWRIPVRHGKVLQAMMFRRG